jgi:hypothetical protein
MKPDEAFRQKIIDLRDEANQAGDMLMSEICGQALAGDEDSIRECGRVIADAASMSNDGGAR